MKTLSLIALIVLSQNSFAAVEDQELLRVTVDTDPTPSKLVAKVDTDSDYEIKKAVYQDGSSRPPVVDPKKLPSGVTLKTQTVAVVQLFSGRVDAKTGTFSSLFEDAPEEFNTKEGGDLFLQIMREYKGGISFDRVRFPFEMKKVANNWILMAKNNGTPQIFDAIKFHTLFKKDTDKDFISSGLSVSSYCEKNNDADLAKTKACEKELNDSIGIKAMELTNNGKLVETLETTSLPGAK